MRIPVFVLAVCGALSASAGEFQNLGFDQPEFPTGVPNPFEGASSFFADFGEWMVPAWSGPFAVGYNYTKPFGGETSLLDANYRNTTQPGNPAKVPVVGQFSLGIWPQSGLDVFQGSIPFTLKQTGDIPAGSQSLRFLYHGDSLKVYVGGAERLVHFTEDRPSGDPELGDLHYFAVDVGLLAGTTVEIRFDFYSFGNYPGMPGGPVNGWPNAKMHVFDDLSFSPLPAVPEPQTWALFGVGLGAMLWFGRRR